MSLISKDLSGVAPFDRLGTSVIIQELSVGQWLDMQGELEGLDEQTRSLTMLSAALHVDGRPIGMKRMRNMGMSVLSAGLAEMNAVLGLEADAGN